MVLADPCCIVATVHFIGWRLWEVYVAWIRPETRYIVGGLTIVLQMFSLANDQELVEICLALP